MMTGKHTVRDVYCKKCNKTLGWMYVVAFEADQKYKEGKFIIERALVQKVIDSPPELTEDGEPTPHVQPDSDSSDEEDNAFSRNIMRILIQSNILSRRTSTRTGQQ